MKISLYKSIRVTAVSAGLGLLVAANTPALAGGGHDEAESHMRPSGHGHTAPDRKHMGEAGHADRNDDHGSRDMGVSSHGTMGSHAHESWVAPPASYARLKSDRWGDPAAIARGEEIYEANCASCHGTAGKGDGPVAGALAHPPANLTQHFHMAPGKGDGYLYWRVSKGGTVPPFNSANSAMPAFDGVLSESQRWDVLAYVHEYIHRGFRMAGDGHGSTSEPSHN